MIGVRNVQGIIFLKSKVIEFINEKNKLWSLGNEDAALKLLPVEKNENENDITVIINKMINSPLIILLSA